jgi:hypothetical protein
MEVMEKLRKKLEDKRELSEYKKYSDVLDKIKNSIGSIVHLISDRSGDSQSWVMDENRIEEIKGQIIETYREACEVGEVIGLPNPDIQTFHNFKNFIESVRVDKLDKKELFQIMEDILKEVGEETPLRAKARVYDLDIFRQKNK